MKIDVWLKKWDASLTHQLLIGMKLWSLYDISKARVSIQERGQEVRKSLGWIVAMLSPYREGELVCLHLKEVPKL